jgi:hypothetical protein
MSACAGVESASTPTIKPETVGRPRANVNTTVANAQYFIFSSRARDPLCSTYTAKTNNINAPEEQVLMCPNSNP